MRAATPRSGRQRSAIFSSRRASGRVAQAQRDPRRLLQSEVAGGKRVGMAETEQQENIRRPRPDSLHRDERAHAPRARRARRAPRDRGRRPSPRASARSARIFGCERPQRLSAASSAATRLAAPSGANSVSRRPKIAFALATDTCCETMIAASPAKPGSRRRSGGGPPTARRRPTTSGSSARSRALASSRAAAQSIIGPG